jgi:type II secretion system protein G
MGSEMSEFTLVLPVLFSLPWFTLLPPVSLLPYPWQRSRVRPCRDIHRSSRRSKGSIGNRGFTIIEVVIVLAIIGILAAIAVPAYTRYIDRSRVNLCIRNIRLFEHAIKKFELDNMRLPTNLNELGAVSLLDENGNQKTQTPPHLDPWGNPYRYLNLPNDNPPAYPNARRDKNNKPLSEDYDLYSMGANGITSKPVATGDGADDIIRASSGAYVGLGANF